MTLVALNSEPDISIDGQRVFFGSSERMTGVPDGSIDLFMTSPPYWNLKKYGNDAVEIGQESYEQYLHRLNTVWSECFRTAKEDALLIVNINSRRYKKKFYPIPFDIAGQMTGWELWDTLIWYIPNALPQPNHYMERLFDNKFEYILVFKKGSADDYTFHKPRVPHKYAGIDPRTHKQNVNGRCLGNILRIPAYRPPNIKELGYHVAAYPEELVALMIETFSNPGDVILDPFLGSGTTLKVARNMVRQGVGYELNGDFSELIKARISENWCPPNWCDIDIIHSSTSVPGSNKPRKAHFSQIRGSLFNEE